jgi:hypothetical protein
MTMMMKQGLLTALVAAMGITTSTAFYLPGVNPQSFADGDMYVCWFRVVVSLLAISKSSTVAVAVAVAVANP